MNYLQNLHTHTRYCDGKDTPEEMVKTAIEKGFTSLGFSGHSYMHFSPNYAMSIEGTEAYKREIRSLQEKYRDKIDLFCGLEFELYSKVDLSGYDYLIGSAHYFKIDGKHVGFDRSAEAVQTVIDEHFHGDGMAYARAYYEQLATLPSYGKFDILGHFDLIAKHVETRDFFDPNSPKYLSWAYEAMDALKGKIPFFEVNTGAIARGYRTAPYPAIPLLKGLLERGFLPVISSDCHDKNKLDCYFQESEELLRFCGARERYILTKEGFQGVGL